MGRNKTSDIRGKIEDLQIRMNRYIQAVQARQYKLLKELEEDEHTNNETNMLMDYQWDDKNINKIDKNFK